MSEETTQAVVDDAAAGAVPPAQAPNARDEGDDLDKLLSQYDQQTQSHAAPPTQPEPKAGPAGDPKTQTDPVVTALANRLFKQDMNETIKQVRGNLDPAFFDEPFVKAWIDGQATQDPRLTKAWLERDSNPKQFQKVVDQLGRNFAKKYGKLPDRNATEDREAVTAAVRGASTKAPEGKAPDFAGMSNVEYREAHKKEYGYYPNV
jgi:hypothetical protein